MKVLIGYDGSSHADVAIDDLRHAGLPQNSEAIVLSAVEWPAMQAIRSWGKAESDFSPEWMERIEAARKLAEAGSRRLQSHFPEWNIQLEPCSDHAAQILLDKARAWPADLIVVGTHGRSALARAVLGSVSSRLIREAPCAVRVARSAGHEEGRLLIGIDGSPEADAAVAEVCGRSWPAAAEIRVLAVQEVIIHRDAESIAVDAPLCDKINELERVRLQQAADKAAGKLQGAGLRAAAVLEQGDPKVALIRYARGWNAGTIFVGARGLGRVEGMLVGSVSSATVAHAPCTVEVVRGH
jgi:nucleotide-binding universal stress UspA family protein